MTHLVCDEDVTAIRPIPVPSRRSPIIHALERASFFAEDFVKTPNVSELVMELVLPLTLSLTIVSSAVGVALLCASL